MDRPAGCSARAETGTSSVILPQLFDSRTRTLEKGFFWLVTPHLHRLTKHDTTQHRHGKRFALGKNSVHVVEVDRHELHFRLELAQMIEPTLEGRDLVTRASRTLRKNDDGMLRAHLLRHAVDRCLGCLAFFLGARGRRRSLDQDSVEYLRRQITPDSTLHPVIPPGDRPCSAAHLGGQSRPHDDEIEVARMVREENPLRIAIDRRGPDCSRAAYQLGQPHQCPRDHLLASSAARRMSLRAKVITDPATTAISAIQRARTVPKRANSIAAMRHPSVTTNILCCFAIGPMKSCWAPSDPASSRT